MRNQDYWHKRWDILQAALIKKSESYEVDLVKFYLKAAVRAKKDINNFYARFAQNNSVTLVDAKKILTTKELKELRWDLEEYIKKARTLKYSQKWTKELENASLRYRISRLEALELQMRQHAADLAHQTDNIIHKSSSELLKESYYRGVYEVQKEIGFSANFQKIDTETADKIIAKPWSVDGSNFSERVWGENRAELVQKLHKELTQSFIRGEGVEPLTARISHDFDVARYKARRLVATENAFFASQGNQRALKNCGVKQFTISATLDRKTCDDCGSREDEKIPMSSWEIGVTAPPFHPNCRCVATPVLDSDYEDLFEGATRTTRGNDGKTRKIENMTYVEWKSKFGI